LIRTKAISLFEANQELWTYDCIREGEAMSGHSHWATIKHKKGAIDAKRGKLWSKLSRAIIIAARHGGGDPTMNLKLRYAIDKARQVSMPKDNIERAIKRGTGDVEGLTFEEITYEGIGPGGVAYLVDVVTDNRNRTSGEIRKIFERGGGKMGSAGNVAFRFERKGLFSVSTDVVDEDTLMGIVLDAGADDMKRSGTTFEITCDPSAFAKVQEALQKNNIATVVAEISQLPNAPIDVDKETAAKVLRLHESLDDHDDVQNVYTDLNMTEELMAEVAKD
jgi:YebC/PmpR family DNA-binding regulatory protein